MEREGASVVGTVVQLRARLLGVSEGSRGLFIGGGECLDHCQYCIHAHVFLNNAILCKNNVHI